MLVYEQTIYFLMFRVGTLNGTNYEKDFNSDLDISPTPDKDTG